VGGAVLVGVAGWSYADWEGRVYPRRKPRGFHPLPYLARWLDLMELNASFYALPNPAHAERWVRLLEPFPAFRFTAKLHRGFTHGPAADLDPAAARAFEEGLAPLSEAGRLLAVLAQFPVSFRPGEDTWARLQRLRALFPDLRLVLELRHRDWFGSAALDRLRGLSFGLAHLDLPAARDHPPAAHASLGDLAYLRLHGRNRAAWFDPRAGRDARYDYRYGRDEVRALTERLRTLAARSEKALLVANNHFGGQAVANALEIAAALRGTPPPAPAVLLDAFPDLRDVVEPEGQLGLF
jgi:uncharacterized protein YecE (DUF72 family)